MFEIYKKGQGTTARWITALALGALALLGCNELEDIVSGHTEATVFGSISVSLLASVAAFIVAAFVIALVINNRRFVDYLVASETELRKVSWPTRVELKRQTLVVIVTLLLISAMLFVADVLFALGSKQLYGF